MRPKIPDRTDPDLAKLIKGCWDGDPKKRPKLKHLIKYFDEALSEERHNQV